MWEINSCFSTLHECPGANLDECWCNIGIVRSEASESAIRSPGRLEARYGGGCQLGLRHTAVAWSGPGQAVPLLQNDFPPLSRRCPASPHDSGSHRPFCATHALARPTPACVVAVARAPMEASAVEATCAG